MPNVSGDSSDLGRHLSETELLRCLDEYPDVALIVGPDGTIRWGNRAGEKLFGRSVESSIGMSGLDFVHPEDIELVLRSLTSIQGKETGSPIELRVRSSEGWRLVEVIGTPVSWLGEGSVLLSIRDLTERRRFEVSHDADSGFRSLVHNAAVLTILLSSDGLVRSCSGALTRLLGHDSELVEGRPLEDLISPGDRPALQEALHQATRGATTVSPVVVVVSMVRYGTEALVPFELSFVNLLDDPTVSGFVVSGVDVTERRRLERELQYQAFHDSLTGLGNRALFQDRLEHAVTRSNRAGRRLTLFFLDVDNLKSINDTLGHAAGDAVLRASAERVRGCLRASDTAARIGGDEFGVLIEDMVHLGGSVVLAEQLLAACREPIQVGSNLLWTTLSIGITFDTPGAGLEQLLQNADRAMYTAKKNGKDRFEIIDGRDLLNEDAPALENRWTAPATPFGSGPRDAWVADELTAAGPAPATSST
jgi:diguanylate cyclase (GGDEF)-like protein/PAS domain S-box-containing protein